MHLVHAHCNSKWTRFLIRIYAYFETFKMDQNSDDVWTDAASAVFGKVSNSPQFCATIAKRKNHVSIVKCFQSY